MLGMRNNTLNAALGAMKAIYRAILVTRTVVADENGDKLAFIQAHGRGDPDDPDAGELVQEDNLDHVQHYGFESYPPVDTELVTIESDGGEACIGERDAVPSVLADLATGDVRIYDEDGQYVLLDKGSKIVVKSNQGDIELIPNTFNYVKIDDAATEFAALANLVLQRLNQIKTDFDSHVHIFAGTAATPDTFTGTCAGTVDAPSVAMTAPAGVACTKLKIK